MKDTYTIELKWESGHTTYFPVEASSQGKAIEAMKQHAIKYRGAIKDHALQLYLSYLRPSDGQTVYLNPAGCSPVGKPWSL